MTLQHASEGFPAAAVCWRVVHGLLSVRTGSLSRPEKRAECKVVLTLQL